jgi:hypothetical protein
MSVFTLDYTLLITEYLPPDKREDVEISWLDALATPLQTLHNDTYLVYRPYITDRAKQTGQKIILESVLNATFGVVGPQFIYIDNSGDDVTPDIFFNEREGQPPFTLYNESEAQPPVYFNNESELTNNRNFVVFVPLAIYTAVGEPAIAFEVDRLRPYSTFYTIQTY